MIKKVTLTKSGLKSLLVEAEGSGWRRRGIRWGQGRFEFCDDFLSDVVLDQERNVVRKKFF